MPQSLAKQFSPEEIRETAMVDLAFHILKEKGEPMQYRNIMEEVARLKGFSDEEIQHYIAQLYTEINIDGRFVCVGKGTWGLKSWYPTEQATDSAVAQNVRDDYLDEDLEEEDLFEDDADFSEESEDGEESYEEDFNGFENDEEVDEPEDEED
jgi:DNA-directed RNA polymerase subunit delta